MVSRERVGGSHSTDSKLTGRILVVDDEEPMRKLLDEMLTMFGHEVVTAVDGQDGIERLQEERFDIVISDLSMPKKTGVDVLKAAKSVDPNYPVVIITGYPSPETAEKLIRIGASEFITKPFEMDRVHITVTKLLAMQKFGSGGMSGPATGGNRELEGLDDEVWTYPQFFRLLRKEVGRSRTSDSTFCLLMVDIDDMERHIEMDGEEGIGELNKTLAEALILNAPPGAFIGYTNRMEFGLILPDRAKEDAVALGERVQANSEWYFRTTFGAACFPEDGQDAESLISGARFRIRSIREDDGAKSS
ncbi:MAG: response regulator [Chloroflexi bacterium]|nr:response regulator [Chloroflexota bacterium]